MLQNAYALQGTGSHTPIQKAYAVQSTPSQDTTQILPPKATPETPRFSLPQNVDRNYVRHQAKALNTLGSYKVNTVDRSFHIGYTLATARYRNDYPSFTLRLSYSSTSSTDRNNLGQSWSLNLPRLKEETTTYKEGGQTLTKHNLLLTLHGRTYRMVKKIQTRKKAYTQTTYVPKLDMEKSVVLLKYSTSGILAFTRYVAVDKKGFGYTYYFTAVPSTSSQSKKEKKKEKKIKNTYYRIGMISNPQGHALQFIFNRSTSPRLERLHSIEAIAPSKTLGPLTSVPLIVLKVTGREVMNGKVTSQFAGIDLECRWNPTVPIQKCSEYNASSSQVRTQLLQPLNENPTLAPMGDWQLTVKTKNVHKKMKDHATLSFKSRKYTFNSIRKILTKYHPNGMSSTLKKDDDSAAIINTLTQIKYTGRPAIHFSYKPGVVDAVSSANILQSKTYPSVTPHTRLLTKIYRSFTVNGDQKEYGYKVSYHTHQVKQGSFCSTWQPGSLCHWANRTAHLIFPKTAYLVFSVSRYTGTDQSPTVLNRTYYSYGIINGVKHDNFGMSFSCSMPTDCSNVPSYGLETRGDVSYRAGHFTDNTDFEGVDYLLTSTDNRLLNYTYSVIVQTYYRDATTQRLTEGPSQDTLFDRWRRPIQITSYTQGRKKRSHMVLSYQYKASGPLSEHYHWRQAQYDKDTVPYTQTTSQDIFSYDDQGGVAEHMQEEVHYGYNGLALSRKYKVRGQLLSEVTVDSGDSEELYELSDFVVSHIFGHKLKIPFKRYFPKTITTKTYGPSPSEETQHIKYGFASPSENAGTASEGAKVLEVKKMWTTVKEGEGTTLKKPAIYFDYHADTQALRATNTNASRVPDTYEDIKHASLDHPEFPFKLPSSPNLEYNESQEKTLYYPSNHTFTVEHKTLPPTNKGHLKGDKTKPSYDSTILFKASDKTLRDHFVRGIHGCIQKNAKKYARESKETYEFFTEKLLASESGCLKKTITYEASTSTPRPHTITQFQKTNTDGDGRMSGTSTTDTYQYTDPSSTDPNYQVHITHSGHIFNLTPGSFDTQTIRIENKESYTYGPWGHLIRVTRQQGEGTNLRYQVVDMTYNSRGLLVKETTRLDKNPITNSTSRSLYLNQTKSWKYDTQRRLVTSYVAFDDDPANTMHTPTYGRLTSYGYFSNKMNHSLVPHQAQRTITTVKYYGTTEGQLDSQCASRTMTSIGTINSDGERTEAQEIFGKNNQSRDACSIKKLLKSSSTPLLLISKTIKNIDNLPIVTSQYKREGEMHYTYNARKQLASLQSEVSEPQKGSKLKNALFHFHYDFFTGQLSYATYTMPKEAYGSEHSLGYEKTYNSWGQRVASLIPKASGTGKNVYFSTAFLNGLPATQCAMEINPGTGSICLKGSVSLKYDNYGRLVQKEASNTDTSPKTTILNTYNPIGQKIQTQYLKAGQEHTRYRKKYSFKLNPSNPFQYVGDGHLLKEKQSIKDLPESRSITKYTTTYPDGSIDKVTRDGAETHFVYNPYTGQPISETRYKDGPGTKETSTINYTYNLLQQLQKKVIIIYPIHTDKGKDSSKPMSTMTYLFSYDPVWEDLSEMSSNFCYKKDPRSKMIQGRHESDVYGRDSKRRLTSQRTELTYNKNPPRRREANDNLHIRREAYEYTNNRLTRYTCNPTNKQVSQCPQDKWSPQGQRVVNRSYTYDALGRMTHISDKQINSSPTTYRCDFTALDGTSLMQLYCNPPYNGKTQWLRGSGCSYIYAQDTVDCGPSSSFIPKEGPYFAHIGPGTQQIICKNIPPHAKRCPPFSLKNYHISHTLSFSYDNPTAPFRRTKITQDNTTHAYTYDDLGNIIGDGVLTYTYTPFNHLASVTSGQETLRFQYGQAPTPVRITDTSFPEMRFYYDSLGLNKKTKGPNTHRTIGNNDAFRSSRTDNEYLTIMNLNKGRLGRVTALIGAKGRILYNWAYTPYGDHKTYVPFAFGDNGAFSINIGDNNIQFLGGREYSSTQKTFLEHDPFSPYSLGGPNGYGYLDGQPVFESDPTGFGSPSEVVEETLSILVPGFAFMYKVLPKINSFLESSKAARIVFYSTLLILGLVFFIALAPAIIATAPLWIKALFLISALSGFASGTLLLAGEATDDEELKQQGEILGIVSLITGIPGGIGAARHAMKQQSLGHTARKIRHSNILKRAGELTRKTKNRMTTSNSGHETRPDYMLKSRQKIYLRTPKKVSEDRIGSVRRVYTGRDTYDDWLDEAWRTGCGNCEEQARLLTRSLDKEGYNAFIYRGTIEDDHVVVILRNDRFTNLAILDSWAGRVVLWANRYKVYGSYLDLFEAVP